MKQCSVKNCTKDGLWKWVRSPFASYFREKRWCDEHKFDGDVHVDTGVKYINPLMSHANG